MIDELTVFRQDRVSTWFRQLRDVLCREFEALEVRHCHGSLSDRDAGRFTVRTTRRQDPVVGRNGSDAGGGEDGNDDAAHRDGGGGLMSVMRDGRVFEKIGINVSTVHGQLGAAAMASLTERREIPGLGRDPRFWASGISLVAHMNSPKVPALHMNTRMFWTPFATWFGGGIDLNPAVPEPADTNHFHQVLQAVCDRHAPDFYPRFREWADRYFRIPHRQEARGAGGIFFDDLASGDWDADFAFVRDVGDAVLEAWMPIVERRRHDPWTSGDREQQLMRRGRYVEFNLLYDRGTRFGLESGHDPDAVLMSLPPLVRWQ